MEFEFTWLVVAALLILASVLAHLVSRRFGAPILLVFLLLGMLAGEDGPGGIPFNDAHIAFLVGSMALAVILFDGGLRTPVAAIRVAWAPALVLATLGVVATAGVVALFLSYAFAMDWRRAMLIGSIVASTDAAAVFGLLGQHGIGLRDRLRATLEVESGANDPMGVFLTIVFVEMLRRNVDTLGWSVLAQFGEQMGIGMAAGIGGGFVLVWLMNRLEMTGGLYPILAFAMAMLVFAGTQSVGGSGFLAVYAAGIVFGNRRVRALQLVGRFFDGLTWLGQIGLFLMLGLLITPSQRPAQAPAFLVAGVLILLARPLAVILSLAPFGFALREQLFVAWVGLRGAVPIFLALIPLVAGLDAGGTMLKAAFVVVLVSLAVQGWTIPFVARLLRVALPPSPEPAPRLDVDLIHQLDRDLIAYEVKPRSRATDWKLAELRLPERVRVVSVLRGEQVLSPESLERLQADDVALVLTPPEHNLAVDRWFSSRFASTVSDLQENAGDFVLDADHLVRELVDSYGLAMAQEDMPLTLAQALHRRLGDKVGRGDRVRIGTVELVILDMIGDEIRRVGLILDPAPRGWRGLVAKFRRAPKP
ncbi:MAG: potassium/proton antiporter [Alphaproteobacteria bacterium]|nr:potassium/proton antiporter [Alphaproteobacteria bacterium]